MKKIILSIVAAFMLCSLPECVFAQKKLKDVFPELSPKAIKDIETVVRRRVKDLNDNIADMANKDEYDDRTPFVEAAKLLFIHKCESYDEYIYNKDGSIKEIRQNEGVRMEVASLHTMSVKDRLMRKYFENVVNFKYKAVYITSTDFAHMKTTTPQFLKYDENGNKVYTCTVTFVQKFHAVTNEGYVIEDITTKTVECTITEFEIIADATGRVKSVFSVALGDVHVDKIEKVNKNDPNQLIPD